MFTLNPKEVAPQELYQYMTATIAPRPIAFATTIDAHGNVNLSPFSFFNMFGHNRPILVFSPVNRGRDGSKKDTLLNILETPEVVINMVHYGIVEQMSLSSCEYEKGVNEFKKAGFTELKSMLVKPPRVKESLVQFECKVLEVKSFHHTNLIICEVLMAHFDESILDENNKVESLKTDWVARMGANWYVRAKGDALFEVEKPNAKKGIGFDNLPPNVRNSKILTGNDLGKLANVDKLPSETDIQEFRRTPRMNEIFTEAALGCVFIDNLLHVEAQKFLKNNEVQQAWLTLLQH